MFPSLQADPAMQVCVDGYCRGQYQRCVRFQYAKNDQVTPPSDLLPNGRRRTYLAQGVDTTPTVSDGTTS